ncbi:MAG: sigma-70 family RNA polymerase sigma factor [Bryobacteraceae bacterium]
MNGNEWLTQRFEANRGHLRAMAYRMVGSLSEADDAVQEAWLRVSRAGAGGVDNLEGWFTTVVARVCLNILRSRKSRREESLEVEGATPLVVVDTKNVSPERQAVLAESVGLALLVVLERLTPAERIAFVLHDVFDVAFEDIGAAVGRSVVAARQLASRARRRVRGMPRGSGAAISAQRETIEAFLAALRAGDMDGLLAILDPDVVRRADRFSSPAGPRDLRGARAVAEEALKFRDIARFARLIEVNGSGGIVVAPGGHLRTVISCKVKRHRISKMEVIANPERLRKLDLAVFTGE